MKHVDTLTLTEGQAMNLIFDAARANPDRQPRALRGGYSCRFTASFGGGHEAVVRNPDGVVVAIGDVDDYDI